MALDFYFAELTPSSASATSSTAADCPTSTVTAEDEDEVTDMGVGVSPADVTMMDALKSDWRDEGTTLICSGGGAVAAAAPPPRGLACRGGGAWACTICCRRGGGGVLCICCSGGGWRDEEEAVDAVTVTAPEGSCVCLMMILVTVGGCGAVVAGGTWSLMAPVWERVVTWGRSRMMLEVQMLVMVFSSGL